MGQNADENTAGVAAAFQFSTTAAANLREKNDYINDAIGGFMGGAVLGLRGQSEEQLDTIFEANMLFTIARTMPSVVGYAILLSVGMGAFNLTGGMLQGFKKDNEMTDYERKEQLKKRARRPIQETINEIGEGRGMHHIPRYSDPFS